VKITTLTACNTDINQMCLMWKKFTEDLDKNTPT
jgi:hypothetical protein